MSKYFNILTSNNTQTQSYLISKGFDPKQYDLWYDAVEFYGTWDKEYIPTEEDIVAAFDEYDSQYIQKLMKLSMKIHHIKSYILDSDYTDKSSHSRSGKNSDRIYTQKHIRAVLGHM